MKKNIAFLGMGMMGRYMASNLAKSNNFTVHAWNRNKKSDGLTIAQSNGCIFAPDFSVISKTCSVICICLADENSVTDVMFGQNGLASDLSNGTIILDFSSIGKRASISIADKLNDHGIKYLDAPVSGGDIGAKNGTLSIMVGGTEEQCLPFNEIFKQVGSKVFYCGNLGNGQAIKSINQLICSINLVAVCEALITAEQLDLDSKTVVEVCSSGAAGSWALTNLGMQITNDDFNPGFMVKHMIKDLKILKQELPSDFDLPGCQHAKTMFDQTGQLEKGYGLELGTQAMFLAYKRFLKP